jgi:prepilin-type N-terminal cleavage/methylation domain-containing protein/prepilin-type processing-associated H-X9-DG protein
MNRQRAFTLIELLVVIAIIAILAAILFPVFAQAKAAAKRTADLSNVKQISLSMPMYANDHDDHLPLMRNVENGADWWTARMKSWKDGVLPYIKNGGRKFNENGLPYQTKGDGGIFEGPLNTAAWSSIKAWGFGGTGYPGDETTRFPRSYAVNRDAGGNEVGQVNCGSSSTHGMIWTRVGDCPSGSGNFTMLEKPAETIMIAPTRLPFVDVSSEHGAYECSAEGGTFGGTGTSCSSPNGNGTATFGFFDGHAKQIKMKKSIADDNWGAYGDNARGKGTNWGQQQWWFDKVKNDKIKDWD